MGEGALPRRQTDFPSRPALLTDRPILVGLATVHPASSIRPRPSFAAHVEATLLLIYPLTQSLPLVNFSLPHSPQIVCHNIHDFFQKPQRYYQSTASVASASHDPITQTILFFAFPRRP